MIKFESFLNYSIFLIQKHNIIKEFTLYQFLVIHFENSYKNENIIKILYYN